MIADWILAALAAEGLGVAAFRAVTGRGPKHFYATLGAGGALLIAWRASESGASFALVGAARAAAGAFHGLDLAARWREPPAEPRIAHASIRLRASRRQAPEINQPSEM